MNSIKVREQIMWSRLISVVEEQAVTLIRTAFCTSVREAGDLSAGVFDARGRMVAQAVTGTPGHVNSMAEAVGLFIDHFGIAQLHPGDVLLTNDPWLGTGHLHDFTVVTPVFREVSGIPMLVAFFASTAHVVDIGGRGFGPDARDVFEEGICIPRMKLFREGELNTDLVEIIRNNVREVDQVIGDLHSLAACNDTGKKRLLEMMDEFDLQDIAALAEFIFENSSRSTREKIAELDRGEYHNQMTVDGYDSPVNLAVTLRTAGDTVYADFSGSSEPSAFGINVPINYTKAYACYALKCAIAPSVPNNWASLQPFVVTAPENCILNAQRPRAVAARHIIGHLIPDVVFGALEACCPGVVPAEGASALWNLQMQFSHVGDGSARELLLFNSGGTGARPADDGLSATGFPSGVQTMSVEVTESVGPIVIWRKELRADSAGSGRQRGGLGQSLEIGGRDGFRFSVYAMFDRVKFPARGRNGGGTGQAGYVGLDDGTVLRAKGSQAIPVGRRLMLDLPGGGGYGPALERPVGDVLRDVSYGYLTAGEAQEDYPHAFSESADRQ